MSHSLLAVQHGERPAALSSCPGVEVQVHHLVGTVVDPVVPLTEPEGTTTVTPAEIIYHRRVRLLALADELGNVAAACRQMGISRTRYYEWRAVVAALRAGGVDAQGAPHPQLPNATPTHVVEDLLTLAVIEPTIGCRQYADRLAERGYRIARRRCRSCSSTTAWAGVPNGSLGPRRSPRRPPGLSTEAARDSEPFGFCHYSPAPGHLVALDSFYIGNLKGVGKVYQLTAIDVATRWAIMLIVAGTPNGRPHDPLHRPRAAPLPPTRCAGAGRAHRQRTRVHRRRVPRPPRRQAGSSHTGSRRAHRTTTPSCERFHGTALQECWRPAFHRRRFTSIRQLQAEADAWLDPLPPPPPQPQRLHARPHTRPNPRQPPSPPSIMTTSHRDHHLSPQPPAGKT